MLFNRMDIDILHAIAAEARYQNLPIVVHTGSAQDVADALSAGVNGIEHGSARDRIPDELFGQMKARGVTYDPTLAAVETFEDLVTGSMEPLERPLVQQVGPPELIQSTRRFYQSADGRKMQVRLKGYGFSLEQAKQNLLAAWRAGVILVTGSDSGNALLFHGPAIH